MMGSMKPMLPVVSRMMTLRLRVIRTTPPSCAAAPISAYFPGDTKALDAGNAIMMSVPVSRPQAAPISRVGMKMPSDTLNPYVTHESG
uniref:Putative secreted protein n=1 Tax=Anopheles triannulatus TaxID=58253 RepID=A0A2M4B164_9DIPT